MLESQTIVRQRPIEVKRVYFPQAIKKGINIIKSAYGGDRIAAFVSIHAYSQFWMSPMGYTYTRPQVSHTYLPLANILLPLLTTSPRTTPTTCES